MKEVCLFLVCLIFFSCKKEYKETEISLTDYQIEDGFELSVVASEPLLSAPVALDFDSEGRIWVAEMTGFMNNIEGVGEEDPTGTIKILEDYDKDGVADHALVFIDSLVMPRALALVYDGLLYVEPPNLWFVEIENDKPKNRVLVDATYAPEGNPEHQANGLLLHLDNWIYNAASRFRYQRRDGVWRKEPTSYRGQWGITRDNFGRLYYNNNSTQLLGDYILPNRLIRNQFLVPKKGINQVLTKDQRVYPIHDAAVNRGYIEGELDADSLLVNVTAACGPLIYRGGNFPSEYHQNAFVCIPEANLIKRNLLHIKQASVTAEQAEVGREFLAATDEGFRPVNMYNGPDGNLYVVDMHLGVIQHYAFLSPYLRQKAKEKQLDTIVNLGRILKIKRKQGEEVVLPDLRSLTTPELVGLLKQQNGWLRDKAQQFLIHKKKKDAVPELKKLLADNQIPFAQMHALYCLEGLGALTFELLIESAQNQNAEVVAHALILLENFNTAENGPRTYRLFTQLLERNDNTIDLYLASTLGKWGETGQDGFYSLMRQMALNSEGNDLVQEALISGLQRGAVDFLSTLEMSNANELTEFKNLLGTTIQRQGLAQKNSIFENRMRRMDARTQGAQLYNKICAACHQRDGEGILGMAPPLRGSEHVADPQKLALILLHGLKGPIEVNGTLYEFNQSMPGLADNPNISDGDIADIISYVTNAFSTSPVSLSKSSVAKLRNTRPQKDGEFDQMELDSVLNKLNVQSK